MKQNRTQTFHLRWLYKTVQLLKLHVLHSLPLHLHSAFMKEPMLFGSSMRRNIDPFTRYPDATLWKALEHVQLKNKLENIPGNIYAEMAQYRQGFSLGERQLVCLARALVRNNRVILYEESPSVIEKRCVACLVIQWSLSIKIPLFKDPPPSGKTAHLFSVAVGETDTVHYFFPLNTKVQPCTKTTFHWHYRDVIILQTLTVQSVTLVGPQWTFVLTLVPAQSDSCGTAVLWIYLKPVNCRTNSIIQHTLRTKFPRSTVLVFAQRLSTVIDLDRVMVSC